MLDEDIDVHDYDTPDKGAYRGHAGYGRWLKDWGAAWADWTMEPQDYIDAGDQTVVVFLMKATGRDSGVAVERQDAMVANMHDGKIASLDYYNNKRQALNAVALEE
jgi:ketosteroid isomerase-like protein